MDETVFVDFWFDPVCPYSWTASRWLHEVARRRPLAVRHHVMSLYLLNERRTDIDEGYRRSVVASRGPARVATAVATQFGDGALDGFYTEFGTLVFDVWRRPTAAEYRSVLETSLPRAGLPARLVDAMDTDEHDAAMQTSHEAGTSLVGSEVGTPITRIGGAAFSGPVLNAIPRGDDALRVFEGARLLFGYSQFYELKRTRDRAPVFT